MLGHVLYSVVLAAELFFFFISYWALHVQAGFCISAFLRLSEFVRGESLEGKPRGKGFR